MKEQAIAIIQARMSSTRLPGKVLKPLAGKPVIWHIYDRASRCKFVDKLIVATSKQSSDDPLADFCQNNGMNVYRGSLDNVLSRYTDILNSEQYPYYVRITGDCPLIHPQFIDNQIMALIKFRADFTWCENLGTAFGGQGVRSTKSLFYIADRSNNPLDFEHVGAVFLSDNPNKFRIVELLSPPQNLIVDNLRLTVDEKDDFLMFTKLYDHLWPKTNWVELADAIELLKSRTDIRSINKNVEHKLLNIEIQEKIKKWQTIKKVGIWKYDNKL